MKNRLTDESAKTWFQKQPPEMFYQKAVLKNVVIFTGKNLCWNFFLIKSQACNFIKKRLQNRCFPENIAKFLRRGNLKNISGTAASSVCSITNLMIWRIRFCQDEFAVMKHPLHHPVAKMFYRTFDKKKFPVISSNFSRDFDRLP